MRRRFHINRQRVANNGGKRVAHLQQRQLRLALRISHPQRLDAAAGGLDNLDAVRSQVDADHGAADAQLRHGHAAGRADRPRHGRAHSAA